MAQLHQDSGPQLLQLKRLGQVVVRPNPQQLHLVGQLRFGRQYDHRRPAGLADFPNQFTAGQSREHQVHQQQINAARLPEQPPLRAGKRLRAQAALPPQVLGGGVVDVGIVFNDQNVGHGTASSISFDHYSAS